MAKFDSIEHEFINLLQEHEGIIHKISFLYSRNSIEKQDLKQEIILQLWKSYPSFEQKSAFSTWMYRVALNTAITLAKKRPLFSFFDTDSESFDPNFIMDYSEDIQQLYKAISKLSKLDKALIFLWLEEKSYEEIAETLGISIKNVSVKLVRIKKKISQQFEQWGFV